MSVNRQMRSLSVLALFMFLVGLFPVSATFAQTAQGTVVASGLANPRGITVGDDGSVYIAEAGNGGDTVLGSGDSQVKFGYSGQVTKVAPDGTKSVVARNLPSSATQEGSVGLHDILMAKGKLWGVIGGVTGGQLNIPGENSLISIDTSTGMSQTVANLGAFEVKNNPDPNLVDSDLYALTLGPDGMVYVADAAGNDILKVDPSNGQASLVAVIPGIPLPAGVQAPPGGNPERGGKNELDPVPTGLAFGPDGNLYVSLLSGGPFPPGAARVMKVTMDGKVSIAAGGLTMLTDIKLGPDGNWYAVEFARFGDQGPEPQSGGIVRITPGGQFTVVVKGLDFPNKIAFDKSGNLYATVNSVTPGAQLVRYNDAASLAGQPPASTPGMPRTGEPVNLPLVGAALALLMAVAGVAIRRNEAAKRV